MARKPQAGHYQRPVQFLLKTTLLLPMTAFASGWVAREDQTLNVDKSYTTSGQKADWVMWVHGTGTLQVVPGLDLTFTSSYADIPVVAAWNGSNGTVHLEDATLIANNGAHLVDGRGGAHISMNGGKLVSTQQSNDGRAAISTGYLDLKNTEMQTAGQAINTGNLNIDGMQLTVTANSTPPAIEATGTATINDLTLNAPSGGGIKFSGDTLSLSNSTITLGDAGTGSAQPEDTAALAITDNKSDSHASLTDTTLTTQGDNVSTLLVSGTANNTVDITGGASLATGDQSQALKLDSDSQVTASNSTFSATGKGSDAILQQAGTLKLVGGTVIASGGEAHAGLNMTGGASANVAGTHFKTSGSTAGILLQNQSNLTAQQTIIDAEGDLNTATVIVKSGSKLLADNLQLTAKGNILGISLDDATLDMRNSRISTEGDDMAGIQLINAKATLRDTSVSTTGDQAVALDIDYPSTVSIIGGQYTTQGQDSHAIAMNGKGIPPGGTVSDFTLDVENATLTTHGENANPLYAEQGDIHLTNSRLISTGAGADAIHSSTTIDGTQLYLETSGEGSFGAINQGQLSLTHSAIKTTGAAAVGLMNWGGSTQADDLQVHTSGKDAAALQVTGGSTHLRNSTLLTEGKGAAGIVVDSDSRNPATSIELDNVQGS